MEREYYLGLDMGTSSVGWAVTDTDYRLLRAKGKDLWGVRLFREAETSAGRRSFRVARRRRQREQVRIGYLRELFEQEISKKDSGFYQRLDDSKYLKEDKRDGQTYALFGDKDYTDKDYYEQYPTIFHLRKELMESDSPHDVRLVFLAILNIFKHRGNFLNENLNDNGKGNIRGYIEDLAVQLEEYAEIEFSEATMTAVLSELLPSKNYSNTGKRERIMQQNSLSKTKDKQFAEMIKLICGQQGKLSVAFAADSFDEEGKKFSVSFRDGNFEEKIQQAEELLSEEAFEIFLLLKQIHDRGVLANILHGADSLSAARVASYEKHQYDLKILKALYKNYAPKLYDPMFRVMEADNYSAYVGSVNSSGESERRGAKCDTAKFFQKIKKQVQEMADCREKEYVLRELEKETFLPKQLTSSNGVIPNQVHKAELVRILEHAENYLDFLAEKDETGLTVSEKIIQLFEFRIPYYVGPLRRAENGNAWVVRKEEGKVFPWNFQQKIDEKKSAELFIDRMVKHCTYLSGENVLPKNSLLYEKFTVLNELNNLRINGEKISVQLKQDLYENLFKKGKKVSGKKLTEELKKNGIVANTSVAEISGIDGEFKNTLSNYAKFCAVFSVKTLTYEQEQIAESIIFWSTVYGDSKKFLKEKLLENYGKLLSDAQIRKILGFKFNDWGRLSRAFLTMEGADTQTGELSTIISRMWNENYNLMELLSSHFTYLDAVKEKTEKLEKTLTEITYEDLEELYISAPVKRMTWQTIMILKELHQVLGSEPKKIFVEMARDADGKKERKDSRKSRFVELYKECRDDGIQWSDRIKNTSEAEFRSKKLYLYYTQKGRCMYTGEIIDLEDLLHNDRYDIDHIYPRHFVKDDSIENNLVLVKKEKNAHKSDTFPIEDEIQKSRQAYWKLLKDGKFITEEKYRRLTRKTKFSDEECAAFINRQLVEVRQGTKVITELFEKTFQNTKIVYVKAGNVSAFRQTFKFLKCRDVNDFHHAQDAYLNIVVGNVYQVKFTDNPLNFVREYRKNPEKNKYHMYHLFEYTVQRNGETAWNTRKDESIGIVRKMMEKQTPLITRMNYEEQGGLADQTIYSAKEAKKAGGVGYLPIKTTDGRLKNVSRYGGFKKLTGTYFFLVEHEVKGKRVRTIEALPLYLKGRIDSAEKLRIYCEEVLGYRNPDIRVPKIKMYSLLRVNGFYLYLTGRTGNQLLTSNAVEMKLSVRQMEYIKKALSCLKENVDGQWLEKNGITKEQNMALYEVLCAKHLNGIFAKRPNAVGEKLQEGREQYGTLKLKDQIYVLSQILQLSKLANMGADLTMIGETKGAGTMKVNKKISGTAQFELIHQSVTGLYEQRIDLLTV